MSRRPGWLVAASVLVGIVAAAPNAAAQETPTEAELAGSIRLLEPIVRVLEPVVRELRTETRKGNRRKVTISTDVLFEFDSAELSADARQILEELGREIAATKGDVTVVGHTDSIGTDTYNQRLSERRARAVADVLRPLLDAGRGLKVIGRGESQPVAPNETQGEDNPSGRARNRRVELTFPAS